MMENMSLVFYWKNLIYGIHGQALSGFQSYLDNRQQFVAYDNVHSVVESRI